MGDSILVLSWGISSQTLTSHKGRTGDWAITTNTASVEQVNVTCLLMRSAKNTTDSVLFLLKFQPESGYEGTLDRLKLRNMLERKQSELSAL